jgi:hypothetical protein
MELSRAALSVLVLGILARPALPQSVLTGTVTDSASRQPLSGAVVQVFQQGEPRGRTLSDAEGRFRVRAEGPVTELRVVRIGFRPQTVALPRAAAVPLHVDIRMPRIPTFLDPVRVVAAQCGGRRIRGRSPVDLIEQARAGLLTTLVSRDENPARMVRIVHERSGAAGRDASLLVRLDSSAAAVRSFTAVQDAGAFVRRGFLDVVDGEEVFYAPDAEVLLADEFAAGYCFRVMPPSRDRPHQVGLGFDAADRRDGRVDITGALWIDTLARELRDIEFRYVGLNRFIESMRPGGSVTFRALPNGLVVVQSWSLALVGLRTDTTRAETGGRARVRSQYVVAQSGGVLAEAEWRDGTQWRAPLPTVSGAAVWADGRPAAGVQLSLRGAPFASRTDATGAFTIEGIISGYYEVLAIDESFLEVGLATQTGTDILVGAADITALRVVVPSREAELARRCRAGGAARATAERTMLLARALYDDGTAVAGATWTLRQLDGDVVRARQTGGDGWKSLVQDGRTGNDGVLLACEGLVRDADVEVTVRTPDGLTSVQRRTLTHGATIVGAVFPRP